MTSFSRAVRSRNHSSSSWRRTPTIAFYRPRQLFSSLALPAPMSAHQAPQPYVQHCWSTSQQVATPFCASPFLRIHLLYVTLCLDSLKKSITSVIPANVYESIFFDVIIVAVVLVSVFSNDQSTDYEGIRGRIGLAV